MLNSHSIHAAILSLIILLSWGLAGCQAPAQQPPPTNQQPVTPTPLPATASAGIGVAWAADGVITPGEYQKNKSFGDFELSWTSDDQNIYMGIKAKTPGWVAVGFDPGLMMQDADIIEGYVTDGKLSIVDMYSTGQFGPHPADIEQGGTDAILASGGKTDSGYTTIEFKRKLDTGDKYDKPLHKGLNKIIWAYGSDPQFTIKHMARGSGEIDL